MKFLFHLGHPAHFHLFKNTIRSLLDSKNEVLIVIKKKDVLEELLKSSGFNYLNILPSGRKDGMINVAIGQLKQNIMLFKLASKFKPDLLIGTSVAISHVGKLKGIPSINVNEDDSEVVPLYSKLAYPWATCILAPKVCSVGKWSYKKIEYDGYHELAYLHPSNFKASEDIAKKYIDPKEKYFIIRFAKLTAHHDGGIKGLNSEITKKLVSILEPHGKIYITSERELEKEFEKYRIHINSIDMHHVMAFASLYIGDSQTMAAEAGVLGVPFVRFNDFVGRIGYLNELENKYRLGFGIKTNDPSALYKTVTDLILLENTKLEYSKRRDRMLEEKINVADFFTWFIENYPKSLAVVKADPNYQNSFKSINLVNEKISNGNGCSKDVIA